MYADIINEFENVTKFALLKYFEDYQNFLQRDFPYLSNYYSGKVETVSAEILDNYRSLVSRGKDLIQTFKNFSSKLANSGFWELNQYCQELYDTLERIGKLPKYNRVIESVRGYKPLIEIKTEVGGRKTLQDIAREVNSAGVNEIGLILENDLQEDDWDIEELSVVKTYINNLSSIVVESIIEAPIDNHVYGKDINRKITIRNNDLDIKKYEENVRQKSDILLSVHRGDVPEFPNLGQNYVQGDTMGNYNYAELLKDLKNIFAQDELFESISVKDVSFRNGDIYATCEIKTKYDYSEEKIIKL